MQNPKMIDGHSWNVNEQWVYSVFGGWSFTKNEKLSKKIIFQKQGQNCNGKSSENFIKYYLTVLLSSFSINLISNDGGVLSSLPKQKIIILYMIDLWDLFLMCLIQSSIFYLFGSLRFRVCLDLMNWNLTMVFICYKKMLHNDVRS